MPRLLLRILIHNKYIVRSYIRRTHAYACLTHALYQSRLCLSALIPYVETCIVRIWCTVRTYLVCVEIITPDASDAAYGRVALLGAGRFAAQIRIRVPLARLKRSILKTFVVE